MTAALILAGCGSDEDPAPSTSAPTAPAESDVIATVEGIEDGEITGADLEAEVLATAEEQGSTPPAPDSPEFDLVAGDALDQLLLGRWIAGDVAEQGSEVTEEEAAALADRMDASGVAELQATWGPRTECETDLVSRLCGGELEAPPGIPPASG